MVNPATVDGWWNPRRREISPAEETNYLLALSLSVAY